jgi:hypothetical protein
MSPADAGKLLLYASAFDNRQPSEAAARAWADVLDGRVTLLDAKTAIGAHYAKTRDWIMPADINTAVLAMRRTRLDHMETPQPPVVLAGDPAREIPWTREYRRAIGDGADVEAATRRACDAIGIATPAQIDAVPRPDAVKQLMAAHGGGCRCGCLTRPVRRAEGAAR